VSAYVTALEALAVTLKMPNELRKNEKSVLVYGSNRTGDVFLFILGSSSFPVRHEVYVYRKTTENLAPSWKRTFTQID
jgi:hypothetical protein